MNESSPVADGTPDPKSESKSDPELEAEPALGTISETSEPRTPPGPNGWPLVGNTIQFVRDPFGFYDRLESRGDVVRYEVFGQTWTVLFHPDHVERVLVEESHRFERPNFESLGESFAPEGLLISQGEQWRRQRQLIQPAFSPARVAAFADAIVDRTVERVDGWSDGETVVANRELSDLTLEILTKTLFDVDLDRRRRVITDAARALNERANVSGLASAVPNWVPTPRNRRYQRAMAAFDETIEDVIAERRAEGIGVDGVGTDSRQDLLSTLLEATDEGGNTLSDDEIRDQLVTFFFAGHETSSLALTYAFLLLSQHDDVRSALEAELEDVCGDERPTMTDLPRLEYTERVVEETLRLYPPAYVLFREALEDVAIDGYLIPKGTNITVSQYYVHRDERWYDDPETFRPERWTDEMRADLPEYAYFPFGGGPRHCVAMRFAMLELKLVLATIAQRVRFDLESDPGPDLQMAATLTPETDVEFRVRKRSR